VNLCLIGLCSDAFIVLSNYFHHLGVLRAEDVHVVLSLLDRWHRLFVQLLQVVVQGESIQVFFNFKEVILVGLSFDIGLQGFDVGRVVAERPFQVQDRLVYFLELGAHDALEAEERLLSLVVECAVVLDVFDRHAMLLLGHVVVGHVLGESRDLGLEAVELLDAVLLLGELGDLLLDFVEIFARDLGLDLPLVAFSVHEHVTQLLPLQVHLLAVVVQELVIIGLFLDFVFDLHVLCFDD
jgi:hypothetical protein